MRSRAPRALRIGSLLVALACCSSCANQHFHVPAEGPPAATARYVELLKAKQVANLHFPAGTYSFYALDDKGFYYRAPAKIIQHSGGMSVGRNGGIFIERRDSRRLRGYIFHAGALTHVGNLSNAPHQLRN